MVLTLFLAICGLKLAHFQGPFSLERGQNCSTWLENRLTCLHTAKSAKVFLEKTILDPFFDPLYVPKQPVFKAFCQKGLISLT